MSEAWTEKYRPRTLDQVVGHKPHVRCFRAFVKRRDMPSILLHGPPGVGKTGLAVAFGREMYGEDFDENFMEKNASDDRTLTVVRGPIKDFANFAPGGDHDFKMLYLGEIDGMLENAQDALKRIMETTAHSVRYIADCNNVDGLIPAIRSRFVRMRIGHLTYDDMYKSLHEILIKEDLENQIGPTVVDQIIQSTDGDLRSAIELLQSLPYDDGEPITAEFIRELAPAATPQQARALWEVLSSTREWRALEKATIEAVNASGWDIAGVLKQIYQIVLQGSENFKAALLDCIGMYRWRVTQPCDALVQLRCCISQTQQILGVV